MLTMSACGVWQRLNGSS